MVMQICMVCHSRGHVLCISKNNSAYRVSQEECARLRERVPYVKL